MAALSTGQVCAADSEESRLLYFRVPYPDDGYSWPPMPGGEMFQA
jgi:hypothetical protein